MNNTLKITMYKRDNYRHHWKPLEEKVYIVSYELIKNLKTQNHYFARNGGKVESIVYRGFTCISKDRLLKTVYEWELTTV